MQLIKRKRGSQRSGKPIEVEFVPNTTGQGQDPTFSFYLPATDEYLIFSFADLEEGKRLLSEAHITYHNIVDEEHKLDWLTTSMRRPSPAKPS